MNLYLRYFDTEVLVDSVSKALDFLSSIPEIDVDEFLANDIRQYYQGTMPYPKRYKVHGKNYFIVIKTAANTLQEFKEAGLKGENTPKTDNQLRKEAENARLNNYQPGWYDASMLFRRIVEIPSTGKCQSINTEFRVRLKATSIQDCYERIYDHLHNRFDVDMRSQMPSIKSKNFSYQYLGMK